MVTRLLLPGIVMLLGTTAVAQAASEPVFYKDVLPILQANCQNCHRPGQIAPMSLLDYPSTRPWARAIRSAVVSRTMPPWFADSEHGKFENDMSLSQDEIDTLVRWVDAGAPAGDPHDAPPPVNWPEEGWHVEPDLVVEGPEFLVPADGIVEWTFVTTPGGFEEDTWVTSIEIQPSRREVVHHICLSLVPPSPDTQYFVPVLFEGSRDEVGTESPPQPSQVQAIGDVGRGFEGCYVPGIGAMDFRPFNAGKLIPAGTDLLWNLHYEPRGEAVLDRPRVGFTVATEPPARRHVTLTLSPPDTSTRGFAIPPNHPSWVAPPAEAIFAADAELVWMWPHMHVRGKAMTIGLAYPDGRSRTVLHVPRYDYNWQLGYETEPIAIPKGTRIVAQSHFDNSTNNRANPDPNQTVYYGTQSWEEMAAGVFGFIVDSRALEQGDVLTGHPGETGG